MKLSLTLKSALLITALVGSLTGYSQKAIFRSPVDTNAVKLFNQNIDSYQPDLTYRVNWEPVAERQITWTKRVWRTIDLSNPANHFLTTPALRSSFASIFFNGILQGSYKAYSNTDERFANELSPENIRKILVSAALNPAAIKTFRIKEDWVYNAREDELVVRIIGIAPLVETAAANGKTDARPAFWVYYPAARPYLAQHPVAGTHTKNFSADNLDKVFELRKFSGTIERVEGSDFATR